MENNHLVENYLKEKNYSLDEKIVSDGIEISLVNDELLIKGTRLDLIELADYIVSTALSDKPNHIHIDDLTSLSAKSEIKSLIIEKIN